MEKQIKPVETSAEEKQTIGRRQLLKALAAGGGAVAASAALSGNWVKPVVEVGVLPAHAQASAIRATYFFRRRDPQVLGPAGPSAMLVTVDGATSIAHVEANNSNNQVRITIDLDINGDQSNDFSFFNPCNNSTDGSPSWSVEGYTLGDPTITIKNWGNSGWEIEVPEGTGTLPALGPCVDNDDN